MAGWGLLFEPGSGHQVEAARRGAEQAVKYVRECRIISAPMIEAIIVAVLFGFRA